MQEETDFAGGNAIIKAKPNPRKNLSTQRESINRGYFIYLSQKQYTKNSINKGD